MSELLHQALILCVRKQCPILRIVIIRQAVDLVDGLGTKLDPLASDEDGGAHLERHIGVELLHYRGHSKDKGLTECLPTAILDSEVEECSGGWETAFRDERAVEQRLMIDLLGLPGNKPMWIFRRGWCCPRGGAGSLSFGLGGLPRIHGCRSRARNL